jgi:1-acyl-sn-glycerol-3-phosphate acyltransferase
MTKLTMKIFNINLEVREKKNTTGCFIAANHSSTVDILLLLQVANPIFITSVEVGESFSTGIITKLSDTVFVERRRKASVKNDAGRIGRMIRNGDSICLFPEGTSSDGTKLLKFKSSLFQSVAKSGIKVQPISIKYDFDHEFKGPEMVGYFGDMTFFQHILNLCKPGKIKVRMDFCEQFSTEGKDRKEICAITEERIREKFEAQ